jgi:hypothetical protein
MRKRKVASILFTGAAAAAGTGMNAPAAFAAGHTWTITPGGAYTADLATGTTAVLSDVNTAGKLTCSKATAAGSLKRTTTASGPTQVGTISKATFGSTAKPCTGPAGLTFTASLKNAQFWASTYTATTGVAKGTIRNISAKITSVDGICHATVTGTSPLPMSYNNGTGVLTVDKSHKAALTVKSAMSCFGAINTGDRAWFSAHYAVTPKQTITQT